jgi:hypothetical protein
MLIKNIQIFDYLNFFNIDFPINFNSFLGLFSDSLLDFIPNIFLKKELEDPLVYVNTPLNIRMLKNRKLQVEILRNKY